MDTYLLLVMDDLLSFVKLCWPQPLRSHAGPLALTHFTLLHLLSLSFSSLHALDTLSFAILASFPLHAFPWSVVCETMVGQYDP